MKNTESYFPNEMEKYTYDLKIWIMRNKQLTQYRVKEKKYWGNIKKR